jgi:prepilin signal peptidase PulO-like enzyme (type II secretory pathway)
VNFLSDFTPTVLNAGAKKKGSKASVIVGVIVGVAVLGLATLAGLFVCIQKRRKLSLEEEGMGYISISLCSNWENEQLK